MMTWKRNEQATCGNCPYWSKYVDKLHPGGKLYDGKLFGNCQRTMGVILSEDSGTFNNDWCGDHPDFWEERPAPDPLRGYDKW
jgi:hypothetical protein